MDIATEYIVLSNLSFTFVEVIEDSRRTAQGNLFLRVITKQPVCTTTFLPNIHSMQADLQNRGVIQNDK